MLFHCLLGIAVGDIFWELCKRYARRGLARVNVLIFFIMVVWGSSGLFVLRFFPISLSSEPDIGQFFSQFHFIYLFSLAVPDWDIPLYIWTGLNLFKHPSLLFSSVIIPTFITIVTLLLRGFNKKFSSTNSHTLSIFQNIAIGLSIGMSAHLLGDVLLDFILYLESLIRDWFLQFKALIGIFEALLGIEVDSSRYRNSFTIEVHQWDTIDSVLWIGLNFTVGLVVPFIVIKFCLSRKRQKNM